MPTPDGRQAYARRAIKFFQAQNYPNKELLILTYTPCDFVYAINDNIRVIRAEKRTDYERITQGISEATGDVIFRWDDDDISFSHRISATLSEFLKSHAKVMGLTNGFFYEYATKHIYYCPPMSGDYMHPSGVFWPSAWEGRNGCQPEKFMPLQDITIMMIGVHKGNTINKRGWLKHRVPFRVDEQCLPNLI